MVEQLLQLAPKRGWKRRTDATAEMNRDRVQGLRLRVEGQDFLCSYGKVIMTEANVGLWHAHTVAVSGRFATRSLKHES